MKLDGLAKGLSSETFDPRALAKGAEVETEHTSDFDTAEHIAMDHLTEDPRYYDKLEKLESGGMLFPTGYKAALLAAGGYGVAGWMIENTLFRPRQSKLFGRIAVPFLPVYAFGGTAFRLLAPKLRHFPWYYRAAVYAAAASGIEWAGCRFDRNVLRAEPDAADAGCLDLPHAVVWGILGLAIEKI